VLLACAAFTPVLRYYGVVFDKAVNVPVTDDYDAGLQFILDYTADTAKLPKKLGLLFAQYNEHRIVLVRLAFLADYVLFGQLNFRHVSLLGNAALLLILTLLFQASFTQIRFPQRLFYFLPVPFLLFQMNFWEFPVWGMAGIQNLYVLVFSLLSFYAINRSIAGKGRDTGKGADFGWFAL